MAPIGSVRAYMGPKQVKLDKHAQANILRQIVDQADRSTDDAIDNATRKPRNNPPYMGNYVDVYV
jgi:hypothetical protein